MDVTPRITLLSRSHPNLPKALTNVQVGPQRPLFMVNGEFGEEKGIFVHGHNRQTDQTIIFFCPDRLVHQQLSTQHGPEAITKYVYNEGFNTDSVIKCITPEIRKDDLNWTAWKSSPHLERLSNLQVNQPGIDPWRLLTLQSREGHDLAHFLATKTPPLLGIILHPDPAVHLLAGNHRGVLALANGYPCILLETIAVQTRIKKNAQHDRSLDPYHQDFESRYIESRYAKRIEAQRARMISLYGCSTVCALAYNLIDQLFAFHESSTA
jgi:hypothetical protein